MASEYVFTEPQTGQPLRKESFIRRSFRPLLKRAGLPRSGSTTSGTARPPDCSSRAFHPKVVQDRLGHSSITVTLDTYSHAIPRLGREAADLFDRAALAD
jgi:integrase